MDWELQDTAPLPSPPLSGLIAWAREFLDDQVRIGLDALEAAGAPTPAPRPGPRILPPRGATVLSQPPGAPILGELLTTVARASARARPELSPVSTAAMGALRRAGQSTRRDVAGMLLAARHDAVFGGIRADPFGHAISPPDPRIRPTLANPISLDLWPLLIAGCPAAAETPVLDLRAIVSGFVRSWTAPGAGAAGGAAIPPTRQPRPGLRLRVPASGTANG